MLIAGLLLLPITLIFIWAYWALLPRGNGPRFFWLDGMLISLMLLAGIASIQWALETHWSEGGAIVPHVMAAAAAYTIFAFGLLILLVVRRALHNRQAGSK